MKQGRPGDRFLNLGCRGGEVGDISYDVLKIRGRCAKTRGDERTVTFDHERLDNVMSDHLKVGVSDPVTDGGLGAGEEVVEDGDFVAQEHESVDQVGSDETSSAGDEDALPVGMREEFDGREAGEGGVGDGVVVWVEDGLGLIVGGAALDEQGVELLLLLWRVLVKVCSGCHVVRAQVEGAQEVDGDSGVEAKLFSADRDDFLARFVFVVFAHCEWGGTEGKSRSRTRDGGRS